MIDSLEKLVGLMASKGAHRFYAKKLAPNDNSKNQVYLGGDFSALNIIPNNGVYTDGDAVAGSKRDRAKAAVTFAWVDEYGVHDAPNAQLILYPKYPEVRMSGLLKGCRRAPNEVMTIRDEGRVLFLGITRDGKVLGYAAGADHPLARALHAKTDLALSGVFLEIPPGAGSVDTRSQLLAKLAAIYNKHWIPSQKLGADGIKRPYSARNGGGYTLEAELGISPNGFSEPDFLGWEIKQYGVNNFTTLRPQSPVTLMTPEPTGGIYRDFGVTEFIRRHGYPDRNGKLDRLNFGGVYACNRTFHPETGLRLTLEGYDSASEKIVDFDGGIALVDRAGERAALWKFTGIIEHWKRKHAQAAYIPSLFRTPPPEYAYGPKVLLCEQTDLSLFLRAVADGIIYYDPAIKVEQASTERPEIKRRSQFRIRHDQLATMYHRNELVNLAT